MTVVVIMRMLIILHFLLPRNSLLIKCAKLTPVKIIRLFIFRFFNHFCFV